MSNEIIYQVIGLSVGLTSLVVSVLAIVIALHHKKEADKLNRHTSHLLEDVKATIGTMSNLALPELTEYGKSMRKFIFHEKTEVESPDDISKKLIENIMLESNREIIEYIADFKTQFETNIGISAKDSNLIKLSEKIENLEYQILELSSKSLAEVKSLTESIYIDLSAINKFQVELSYGQFKIFSDLLHTIYVQFLAGKISPFTYGISWSLLNQRTNMPIQKETKRTDDDKRTLAEIDILPGDTLIYVTLKTTANKK